MKTLLLTIKSRTVWTGIVMYAINFAPFIGQLVPLQWKPMVDALLTLAMFYFHVSPSQNYSTPTV